MTRFEAGMSPLLETRQTIGSTPGLNRLRDTLRRIISPRLRMENQIVTLWMTSQLAKLFEQLTQCCICSAFVHDPYISDKPDKFRFRKIRNVCHVVPAVSHEGQ